MIIGAIRTPGTVGVDVSALVAGLGLAGFAIGFALRDAVSNTLAGVLVLMYQPFRVGDDIKTGGSRLSSYTRHHRFCGFQKARQGVR